MEIIRDIEQGSDDWLMLRLGIPTASEFSNIVTAKTLKISSSIDDYAKKLAGQLLIESLELSRETFDMERGKELEPYAITEYEQDYLIKVERVSFIKNGEYGFSPDGLIGDDGFIEVKSHNQSNHAICLADNAMPSKHIPQVQGGLLASEREWCDFISYNPTFEECYRLFVIRIYRDEKIITKLKEAINKTIELRDMYLEKIKKGY